MNELEQRWQRVAEAVNARMADLLIADQSELMELADFSDATARVFMTGKLRNGKPPSRSMCVKLCRALEWRADSVDRLLAGESAMPLPPAADVTQLVSDVRDELTGEIRKTREELERVQEQLAYLVEIARAAGDRRRVQATPPAGIERRALPMKPRASD